MSAASSKEFLHELITIAEKGPKKFDFQSQNEQKKPLDTKRDLRKKRVPFY